MGRKVKFDKLYRWDRNREHCYIAVPVKKGQIRSAEHVRIFDGERVLPSQTKVTSRYEDGSVRFLFTRFMADLPGNSKKELDYEIDSKVPYSYTGICVEKTSGGFRIDGGELQFTVQNDTEHLFEELNYMGRKYSAE